MPRYVALAKIFFDDADAGTEGWAQGQAQWLKDNTDVCGWELQRRSAPARPARCHPPADRGHGG